MECRQLCLSYREFLGKEVKDPDIKQRNIEVDNTIGNYDKQLVLGVVDVEPTLTEFLNALKKVGVDEKIAELQKALDEFNQSKGKN